MDRLTVGFAVVGLLAAFLAIGGVAVLYLVEIRPIGAMAREILTRQQEPAAAEGATREELAALREELAALREELAAERGARETAERDIRSLEGRVVALERVAGLEPETPPAEPGSTTATIQGSGPEVRGSLSAEVIRRVVRRHLGEVRVCYERELASRPDLEGRVVMNWIISPTGSVQRATVASSTLEAPAVEACIAQAVRRWAFPSPTGGGIVGVNYPFMLRAS